MSWTPGTPFTWDNPLISPKPPSTSTIRVVEESPPSRLSLVGPRVVVHTRVLIKHLSVLIVVVVVWLVWWVWPIHRVVGQTTIIAIITNNKASMAQLHPREEEATRIGVGRRKPYGLTLMILGGLREALWGLRTNGFLGIKVLLKGRVHKTLLRRIPGLTLVRILLPVKTPIENLFILRYDYMLNVYTKRFLYVMGNMMNGCSSGIF
jgi:hypothetical protein